MAWSLLSEGASFERSQRGCRSKEMTRSHAIALPILLLLASPPKSFADDAMAPVIKKEDFVMPEGISEIRRKIIEAALSQIGTISSHPSKTKDLKGERYGWERLGEYVKAALSWDEIPKDWMKKIKAVQTPDKSKQPHPANNWCGFFCAYALKQAGIDKAKWRLDSTAFQKSLGKPRRDLQNMKPGDIALFSLRSHHAIVAKVEGKSVQTIDGNAAWGEVNLHQRTLGKGQQRIIAFHSIDDILGNATATASAPRRKTK
jgi:hypothetical protein